MNPMQSGTLAGTGSFRCEACGYVLAQPATERLAPCPSCGERRFARASLFAVGSFERDELPSDAERAEIIAEARQQGAGSTGPCLAFRDGDTTRVIAIGGKRQRIGRSLTAEIRFDDTTVSRRHALLVSEEDGSVRVLDDQSLNGVFVNGRRVQSHILRDGDELIVGRHRIAFLAASEQGSHAGLSTLETA